MEDIILGTYKKEHDYFSKYPTITYYHNQINSVIFSLCGYIFLFLVMIPFIKAYALIMLIPIGWTILSSQRKKNKVTKIELTQTTIRLVIYEGCCQNRSFSTDRIEKITFQLGTGEYKRYYPSYQPYTMTITIQFLDELYKSVQFNYIIPGKTNRFHQEVDELYNFCESYYNVAIDYQGPSINTNIAQLDQLFDRWDESSNKKMA